MRRAKRKAIDSADETRSQDPDQGIKYVIEEGSDVGGEGLSKALAEAVVRGCKDE